MRKLSKKISMLVVLAMLVSLFSGVVSASAASVWSFYNKTTGETVAVNETIEMEKGEFADFDLCKEGKAVTKDTYTVVYASSDEEVVWVDAKNGKLRADKYETAEAGDEAVISATFTNVETGKSATRSFTIAIAEEEVEVPVEEEETYTLTATVAGAVLGAEALVADKDYALAATVVNGDGEAVEATIAYTIAGAAVEKLNLKAGEYTVVVTATLDGEVIATESYAIVVEAEVPEVVAKKQTSLTTVEITLNNADWAKKFAENIKLSYFAGDVEIADLVKSVEVADATVKVALYNNMIADVNYKFAFNGYDCAATIKGAKAEPARISVVGGNVAAGTEGDLKVNFYTAEGVDITPAFAQTSVVFTGTDDSVAIVAGQKIYFFEAGKATVVNAEYDMGFDANGNELTDLKASGLYYSVNEYTTSNLNGYAAAGAGATAADLTYGNNIVLSLSDTTNVLWAKYTRTKYDGTTNPVYVQAAGYTYYSTNESVLLVEKLTGALTPCSEGIASVYVKNADDVVVGSVTVNVKGYRGLNTFTASMSDRMVSVSATYTDSTTINVTTKDQLGDYIDATWDVEIVNPAGDISDYLDWDTVTNNGAVTGITLTPNTNAISNITNDSKVQVVTFKVKATVGDVTKTWNGSVSIKNVTGVAASTTVLDVSASSVDMKLNKNNTGEYNVTAKLVKRDAAGYDLGLETYTYITNEADADTTAGAYSIIIKKNAETTGTAASGIIADADDVITFSPVTGDPIVKTGKDTYTIKVFKGNGTKAQLYATKTVSFTDTTPAISANVTNTNVNTAVSADLKAAIEFYRNGAKINDKIDTVAVSDATVAVDGKIYVKKVTVTIQNSELNNNFAGTHTEEVVVNKLFTTP